MQALALALAQGDWFETIVIFSAPSQATVPMDIGLWASKLPTGAIHYKGDHPHPR
jgi:hypothetical protein